MKRLYFRKNGYVIEYPKLTGTFVWYIFLRSTAFLIDVSLFIGLQIILYYVFKTNFIFSMFFGYSAFLIYNLICSFIFKNKTFGMFVARLVIVNYDGYEVKRNKMIIRMFIYAFYIIPFLGWFLVIVSFISLFLTRGLSVVCVLSKTQIVTTHFNNAINQIYKNIK